MLKILRRITGNDSSLSLNVDSFTLEKLARSTLQSSTPASIENSMKGELLKPNFGISLSSRVDMIRNYLKGSEYDGQWIDEMLSDLGANLLYTYALFLVHVRRVWNDEISAEQAQAQKQKKTKRKRKKKQKGIRIY